MVNPNCIVAFKNGNVRHFKAMLIETSDIGLCIYSVSGFRYMIDPLLTQFVLLNNKVIWGCFSEQD